MRPDVPGSRESVGVGLGGKAMWSLGRPNLSLVETSMVEEEWQDGPPRGILDPEPPHGLQPLPALPPGPGGELLCLLTELGQQDPPGCISVTLTHICSRTPFRAPPLGQLVGELRPLSKRGASPHPLGTPDRAPPDLLSSFPSYSPMDPESCDNGEYVPSDKHLQVSVVEKHGPTPWVAETFHVVTL